MLKIKNHTFFIISFIVIQSGYLFGQNFAGIGTEWYYHEGFAFSGDIDYIKFTAEKDTIINDQACIKIIKRHKIECLNRSEVEFLYYSNDTVYFYEPSINDFQILYDFNSVPNDHWEISINIGSNQNDSLRIVVDSTSSENINGLELKVLYVSVDIVDQPYSYNSTFVERIGDINYMFYWYYWATSTCDVNWTRGLQCFQDSEIGLFSTGLAESCDYTSTNMNQTNGLDNSVKIFPNPTAEFLNIEFEDDLNHDLELSNINGEILLIKTVGRRYQMDVSSLPVGIYLLKVITNDQVIFVKKIMRTTTANK